LPAEAKRRSKAASKEALASDSVAAMAAAAAEAATVSAETSAPTSSDLVVVTDDAVGAMLNASTLNQTNRNVLECTKVWSHGMAN
jgi:hypothetical protein